MKEMQNRRFTYLREIYQVNRSIVGSFHSWYLYTKLTYFRCSRVVALDENQDLQQKPFFHLDSVCMNAQNSNAKKRNN